MMYLAAAAVGLCLAGSALAQPDRGPTPRPAPKAGADMRKLEADLEQLSARLNELEARLARMQQPNRPAPKDGGPGRAGPGRPGFGTGIGPAPKDGPGFGRRLGQPGPSGFRVPDRGGFGMPGMGEPRGFGGGRAGGPGAGPNPDVARRLDRIISELEQLKRDLQAPKR
jgi:hypothetical protein